MLENAIDYEAMLRFLVGLLNTPSPTGYHREALAYTRQAFEELGIIDLVVEETRKGALLLTWRGERNDAPLGLTAHMDTLGFMVRAINRDGTLKLSSLGGINWSGAEFENCSVRTYTDQRYRGTIMLSNPSTHVNKDAQRRERNADSMELRLDERTSNRAETEALGIGVGDFVFLDPRVEVLDNGFIRSRFLDDKASVACVYGALSALKAQGKRPVQDTAILISNYEEVGHGGAAGWPAGLADLVAIDMAAIGEDQNSDEFAVSICVKDGGGPYHFDLTNRLRRIALERGIPHKTDIYVYYSSDGTAYWRSGGEARVALIGPGVSASHGYERTHRDTLMHTTHLIAALLLDEEA